MLIIKVKRMGYTQQQAYQTFISHFPVLYVAIQEIIIPIFSEVSSLFSFQNVQLNTLLLSL